MATLSKSFVFSLSLPQPSVSLIPPIITINERRFKEPPGTGWNTVSDGEITADVTRQLRKSSPERGVILAICVGVMTSGK